MEKVNEEQSICKNWAESSTEKISNKQNKWKKKQTKKTNKLKTNLHKHYFYLI